ncbi:WD40 repeat domain-containing protein, partial [Myxococcota bacterium]|nr:WD40 repeat domain-containing protein [Myxococcota bacterium]
MTTLTVTLTRSIPMLPGAWIGGADLFNNGRVLALCRMAEEQTCYRWITPEGWQEPIRWGRDFVGDVSAVNEELGVMVLGLDGDAQVYDARTGAYRSTLAAHSKETYLARALPHGRLLTEGTDGFRRIWDLATLTLLAEAHMRPFRLSSAPVGLLPGDPVLVTRSYVRSGRWGTALVNMHTGKDARRIIMPCEGVPAFHAIAPRPGALEWAGVFCAGRHGDWGPSRVVHFAADGPRLIDEEPESGSIPGVVGLSFLTADWLYTDGWRDPMLINVRTGERRACPREG